MKFRIDSILIAIASKKAKDHMANVFIENVDPNLWTQFYAHTPSYLERLSNLPLDPRLPSRVIIVIVWLLFGGGAREIVSGQTGRSDEEQRHFMIFMELVYFRNRSKLDGGSNSLWKSRCLRILRKSWEFISQRFRSSLSVWPGTYSSKVIVDRVWSFCGTQAIL